MIFCTALSSCRKLEKDALADVVGDYHWSYTRHSSNSDVAYTTNTETTDQYGARITSKNQLILFKNGIEVNRYKIVDYYPHSNGYSSYIQIKARDMRNILYSSGDTLTLQEFPFSENVDLNYFIKTN